MQICFVNKFGHSLRPYKIKIFKVLLSRFFYRKSGTVTHKHAKFTDYIEIAENWLQNRIDTQCSDTKAAGSFWTIIRRRDI